MLSFIQNWRLITLLNSDYKNAAERIGNRLKSVLPSLINYDQTSFVKKKKDLSASTYSRLIDCFIHYAAERTITGLLLFIDFATPKRPYTTGKLIRQNTNIFVSLNDLCRILSLKP